MIQIKNIYKIYPKSVWILTLIEFIFIARKTIFNVSRDVNNYSATVDSSTSLAMLGIGLGSIFLYKNQKQISKIHHRVSLFSIYYLFAICSIFWAGSAGIILFKASEILVCFYLTCLIFYFIRNTKRAILYTIFFATIASSCDFFNTLFKLGFHALHTNAYTMSAMIGLLLAIGCVKYKVFTFKQLDLLIYANSLFILLGTSSATYISIIIGILFLYTSSKKGINILTVCLFSFIIYIIYDLYSEDIIKIIFPGRSIESIESGTGRSAIWKACINSWMHNPLLGKGFIVGERNLGAYGLGINVLSAHNSFLSTLVNTGIIGMIIFFRFLSIWFFKVYQFSSKNIYATIIFPAMVATIINCGSCPALGSDWTYVSSCIYALIAMSFLLLPQQQYHKSITQ